MRREAKASEKKRQNIDAFHERLTFLKNPALAGRPEKRDPKKQQELFFQCSTFNASRAKSITLLSIQLCDGHCTG
jgi:hypothetical protein